MKEPEGIPNNTGLQARQAMQNIRQTGPVRRFVWGLPLAWQLGVLYVVLLVLTLSLVGWLVYSQQQSFLMQDTSQRLVLQAERIASISDLPQDARNGQGASRPWPGPTDTPRDGHNENPQDHQDLLVRNLVQGLSGPGVTVAVLDTNGTVITTTQALDGESTPVVEAVNAEQVSRVLNTRQPVQWTVKAADGTRQVVVLTAVTQQATSDQVPKSAQLVQSGQSAGVTLLVEQMASLAAVDAALDQLRLLLLLGILGGTLVGVALVLAFTRGVLRPLERVVDTADAISAGDLHRRLALPQGRSEVARLGKAFDSMVGRLVATLENQRRFVADASHELRTPLTSIKEGTGLLLDGVGGETSEKQRKLLSILAEESNRLISVVNSLLDLSKLEAGMMAYDFEVSAIDSLLKRAVAEITPLLEAKQIRLQSAVDPSLPQARLDPERVLQVLRNLLGNAVKFTPRGGRVKIAARAANGKLEVSVKDSGPGIPADSLVSIFEKFNQGNRLGPHTRQGTGLGLAIAKSIITAHGGKIWAESELGQGSTFIFVLPC
jgi:signal transduction histidine kinase